MSNPELYQRAKYWLNQGAELVPIRSGTKASIKGYGSRSRHVTDEKSAWYWWGKLGVNLGVVCGGVLGLSVLDFDDADLYDAWRLDSELLQTYTEKTGRGYHVFFTTEDLPNVLSKQVELRTSGTVMVAPSVHPNSKRYEIVQDGPIAKLSRQDVELLFPFVSEILNRPVPRQELVTPPLPSGEQATGVIAKIKATRRVSEEAQQLTTLLGKEGHYYGVCPFHEDKQPSFWVDDTKGIWGCHSPACPTNEKGKAHDVINLRAFATGRTGRDFKEVIRELAAEVLPPLSVKTKQSK